jgi:haloalkane dehalogenase
MLDRRQLLNGAALAGAALLSGCARSSPRSAPSAPLPDEKIDAAWYHAHRRFIPTAFGRIAYVERGSGPAAALFLHGLPLNSFQWRGALERLAPLRRCIAPDSLGLGYTEVSASQDLGPVAQMQMCAAFLDALGIDAVDLVASDSGGAIAQLFVAAYPARVKSLLLTNCDAHEDSPPPVLLPVIEAARAGTFVDEVLLPQLRDRQRALAPSGLAGCCYSQPDGLTDEAIAYYFTPLAESQERRERFHAYCVALADNPLLAIEPKLRQSQVPVRILWGAADTTFDQKSADWLHRTFPRSRGVRRIPGANLFFPEELPDLVAEEARALWQATSA